MLKQELTALVGSVMPRSVRPPNSAGHHACFERSGLELTLYFGHEILTLRSDHCDCNCDKFWSGGHANYCFGSG